MKQLRIYLAPSAMSKREPITPRANFSAAEDAVLGPFGPDLILVAASLTGGYSKHGSSFLDRNVIVRFIDVAMLPDLSTNRQDLTEYC